ncbi:HAD family hydrolase [Kineococcus gynurae]|uniref:HAD family hydrolase n=1 Tax=Kineococcus gynurae TaxID=452979 RepID=A0ABV5LWQ2_9ACTN
MPDTAPTTPPAGPPAGPARTPSSDLPPAVPPRVPLVGFDLDMTLVDSREGIAATLRRTLAEVGVTVTDADVWPWTGMPLDLILGGLVPDAAPATVRVLAERYRELYPGTGVDSVTALPGAVAALAGPHAHGGRSVVVSAKHTPNVHRVLAAAGLTAALGDGEVAGDLFAEAKGVLLGELGATAYVGDHPGDVRAARVAGAVAVGVATGAHTARQLLAEGADVVLADLGEFPAWLAGHATELRGPVVPDPRDAVGRTARQSV